MPVTAPPAWCLCGHTESEHVAGRRCRARDDDGHCDCTTYELDQEA